MTANPPAPRLLAKLILAARLESALYRLMKLAALPARLIHAFARPRPDPLSYSDLLDMLPKYRTIPRPTFDEEDVRQLKWARRVAQLARAAGSSRILEVGCGRGMASLYIHQRGFHIDANDMVDRLDPRVKAAGLCITLGDACAGLPYADAAFDLVFSINSLEHFDPPEAAIDEILRVLRPGGLFYAAASPLYFAPWGLHANRRLGMPYPQLLFTEADIQRFVDENSSRLAHTYSPGSDRTTIAPYLNRRSIDDYRRIFAERRPKMAMLAYAERPDFSGWEIFFRFPGLLKARSPSFDSLLVTMIKFLAVRR